MIAQSNQYLLLWLLSVGLSIPSLLALAHPLGCSKACAFRTTDEHLKKGESFPKFFTTFAVRNNNNKTRTVSVVTMPDARITNLACFIAGAAVCLFVTKSLNRKAGRNGAYESSDDLGENNPISTHNIFLSRTDGATAEGKDLSLFYGDKKELTTITDSRKFLPSDVYGELVRKCVVCCVDIVVVRKNSETGRKECVLVERASEPAKGVWWWPGGRLLKGETFFDAAKRKTQQETGLKDVTPIQV